jgi:hypothetical protein
MLAALLEFEVSVLQTVKQTLHKAGHLRARKASEYFQSVCGHVFLQA